MEFSSKLIHFLSGDCIWNVWKMGAKMSEKFWPFCLVTNVLMSCILVSSSDYCVDNPGTCQNGGTCVYHAAIQQHRCVCDEQHMGSNCELSKWRQPQPTFICTTTTATSTTPTPTPPRPSARPSFHPSIYQSIHLPHFLHLYLLHFHLAIPLFVQPFIPAYIKQNIKSPRYWPFVRGYKISVQNLSWTQVSPELSFAHNLILSPQ